FTILPPPSSTLFPYTTLFRSCLELLADSARASANKLKFFRLAFGAAGGFGEEIDTQEAEAALEGLFGPERRIEFGWAVSDSKLPDRKSTRLNSSHLVISYAVF